jgi:hypothetical protein
VGDQEAMVTTKQDRAGQDEAGPADGGSAGAQAAAPEVWERAARELDRLEGEQKELGKARAALRPFTVAESYTDLTKLGARLATLEKSLEGEVGKLARLGPLVAELESWRSGAAQRMRKSVGRELKDACAAAGLELTVVSREDPIEVRIPPLSVVLDFTRGQAELRFARLPVATCGASAGAIVLTHRDTLRALDSAFDARAYFDLCWAAYGAACAAAGKKRGERVEIQDFLPHLALLLQSKKFQTEPIAANWRDYPRARFAYDVHRLRKAGGLSQSGRRMNFGVATGTTAGAKARVLYIEDEHGRGEYKLTIYFSEG